MMMALLTLKSRLKGFYEKHYRILRCFGKAVLMIITLMIITSQLNYQAFLANHWIVLLLAVICAVTPDVASPLCAFLVTEIEVFQVSELIAVAILLIVLIYYLLFGRLANRQSVVLASVPVLSVLQITLFSSDCGRLVFFTGDDSGIDIQRIFLFCTVRCAGICTGGITYDAGEYFF